jgi:hypothetical protein
MAHDLQAAAARVSKRFFKGVIRPRVKWSRGHKLKRRPVGYVCAIYDPNDVTIHVHPAFKGESTPKWVIDYLLYHECLHAIYGAKHGPRFRAADKKHPDYHRADDWLAVNVAELAWKIGRK